MLSPSLQVTVYVLRAVLQGWDLGPRRHPGGAPAWRSGCRGSHAGPHLLQPSSLLLLLLNALLALSQQLPLVLLILPLLLLQLLAPQGLRTLLVGQLQSQEVSPQRRLPWQVQDGAVGRAGRSGCCVVRVTTTSVPGDGEESRANTSPYSGKGATYSSPSSQTLH